MKTIEIQSKHNQNATLKPNTCERIKIQLTTSDEFVLIETEFEQEAKLSLG